MSAHTNRFTELLLGRLEENGRASELTSDAYDNAKWLVRESDYAEDEFSTPADKVADRVAQAGHFVEDPASLITRAEDEADDGNWFNRLPPASQERINALIDAWNADRSSRKH